jgi:CDP-diacylglycerol--serine O-phosphatidyltransferase
VTVQRSFVHPANFLTYASLALGLASVAAALQGSPAGAGACLALAALADTFDGRFARLFTRTREDAAIGAELDSLVDAVSFGAAPVVVVAILLSRHPNAVALGPWWIASIIYVACALTRLARFNVRHADSAHAFVGLPTPVAALIWSSVLLTGPGMVVSALVALALGLAMIAPLPIARPGRPGLALFALWPLTLVLAHLGYA